MSNHTAEYNEAETFTEPNIIAAVSEAIFSEETEITVRAYAVWERKGQIDGGPLDSKSSYHDASDDIIVSLEVRLPCWEQPHFSEIQTLVGQVLKVRAEAAAEAATQSRLKAIATLEAEILAIKASMGK